MLCHYSRLWYGVLEDSRDRSDWVYVGYEGFEILRRRADHQSRHCSGGTILSDLVNAKDDAIRKSTISGLVRGEAKAKVLSEKGIDTELFSDLDANDEIEKVASGYDGMQPPPPPRLSTSVVDDTHQPFQWSFILLLAFIRGPQKH